MANLVNYALAYAEKGMSVLPMSDKQPLIKFANQPPLTPDEIKEIWGKHPDAQLALRTTNFFVVDIDTKEAHGEDGFKSIEEFKYKDLLLPTLSLRTSTGGRQLFYLKRDDIESIQHIKWMPGVDVKAHINNYTMVPPSEINGKKYEWENHNPIVTPSKKLIQLINQREKNNTVDFTNYNSGTKTATTKLFESLVNGLGDNGSRNNELTSLIGGLLYRNVEADKAYQLAVMANENTPDPLPDKELNRTFESMLDKDIRRRGGGEV